MKKYIIPVSKLVNLAAEDNVMLNDSLGGGIGDDQFTRRQEESSSDIWKDWSSDSDK